MSLRIGLEGLADSQVELFSIDAVPDPNETLSPATEAFVDAYPEGNDTRMMSIDLDRAGSDPLDDRTGKPFFREQRIGLNPHADKESLIVDLKSESAARSFRLVLHYEVDHVKYDQVVSRNGLPDGPPFRVSPSLCPDSASEVTAEQRKKLTSMKYKNVRSMATVDGRTRLVAVDVTTYCH
jgi:hypothetical protein